MIYSGELSMPHARGDEPDENNRRPVGGFRMPHARGDEPNGKTNKGSYRQVCPTHVGMNRLMLENIRYVNHVCPTHVGMNRTAPSGQLPFTVYAPRTWG